MTTHQASIAMLAAVMLLAAACGCQHPRLSIDEFLLSEQQAAQVQTATPSPPPEQIAEVVQTSMGPQLLGAGDVLDVAVTPGYETIIAPPVRQRINEDGGIELPLVGSVKIGGLTLVQAEQKIRQAYVPDHYKSVIIHVELTQPEATKVLVLGQVARPGIVPLRRSERNLLFAVDQAGGAALESSGKVTLRRMRQPNDCQTFNLRCPDELRKALALAPLEDGDMVYVQPAQPNTVFVGGLVTAGGPQIYPRGTEVTALQALAAAGGPRPDLFAYEATLIRRRDGKDVHVKLNMDRMARGLDPNFALASGDILWMPHTAGTRVIEFLNNTLYFRVGGDATYSVSGASYHGDLKDSGTSVLIP